MEEDIQYTPPEILNKSLETPFEILPQKSVEKYNRQYDIFMEWCKKHGIKKYSENVLLAYFSDLSKEYSPSSMWSYYSMVKATLSAKNDINISNYKKLTAFLKQEGRNHIPKTSKILSYEDILEFLLNAPDEIYLMMKICILIGISGACRNDELLNLKVSDIEHQEKNLIIHLTKTKTNRPRLFVITSEFEGKVKSIELFKKYLLLRPKETPHDRFFITYRNGKCTVQPVGIHTFGILPRKIAKYLNLPEPSLYTGHCFRHTSLTLFGWKSDKIEESHVEESMVNQMKIEKSILCEDRTDNIVGNDNSTEGSRNKIINKILLKIHVDNDMDEITPMVMKKEVIHDIPVQVVMSIEEDITNVNNSNSPVNHLVNFVNSPVNSSVNLRNSPVNSSVNLRNSPVNLGNPSVNLRTPSINLGNPSVNLGNASINLGNPSVNLGTPSVNLGNSSVTLGNSSVNLGNSAVNLGTPSVNLSTPSVNLGNSSVNLGNPSVNLGNSSFNPVHSSVKSVNPMLSTSEQMTFPKKDIRKKFINRVKSNRNFQENVKRTYIQNILMLKKERHAKKMEILEIHKQKELLELEARKLDIKTKELDVKIKEKSLELLNN